MSEEQGKRVGVKKEEAEDANVKCSNRLCSNMPSKTAKFCGKCRTPLTVVPSTPPSLVGVPAGGEHFEEEEGGEHLDHAPTRTMTNSEQERLNEALHMSVLSVVPEGGDDDMPMTKSAQEEVQQALAMSLLAFEMSEAAPPLPLPLPVGIANQGGTCYLNALLQALFSVTYFRMMIFKIPVPPGTMPNQSIALALQRLFFNLETRREVGSTKELTDAFGMNADDVWVQEDIHEGLKNLLGKLKTLGQEKSIKKMMMGQFRHIDRCLDAQHEDIPRRSSEAFEDLELTVKDKATLEDSLKFLFSTEKRDFKYKHEVDENDGTKTQHECASERSTTLKKMPPILFCHPNRSDATNPLNVRLITDRWEFPNEVNLRDYETPDHQTSPQTPMTRSEEEPLRTNTLSMEDDDTTYVLQSVAIHWGKTVHAGHYWTICRQGNRWVKLNDGVVSEISQEGLENEAFGGNTIDGMPTQCALLVYINKSILDKLVYNIDPEKLPRPQSPPPTIAFSCIGISTDPIYLKSFGQDKSNRIMVDKDGTVQDLADAAQMHFKAKIPKGKKVHCWFYHEFYGAKNSQILVPQLPFNQHALYYKPSEKLRGEGRVAGNSESDRKLLFCNVVNADATDPFSLGLSCKLLHAVEANSDGSVPQLRVFESVDEFKSCFLNEDKNWVFQKDVTTGFQPKQVVGNIEDLIGGSQLIVCPKEEEITVTVSRLTGEGHEEMFTLPLTKDTLYGAVQEKILEALKLRAMVDGLAGMETKYDIPASPELIGLRGYSSKFEGPHRLVSTLMYPFPNNDIPMTAEGICTEVIGAELLPMVPRIYYNILPTTISKFKTHIQCMFVVGEVKVEHFYINLAEIMVGSKWNTIFKLVRERFPGRFTTTTDGEQQTAAMRCITLCQDFRVEAEYADGEAEVPQRWQPVNYVFDELPVKKPEDEDVKNDQGENQPVKRIHVVNVRRAASGTADTFYGTPTSVYVNGKDTGKTLLKKIAEKLEVPSAEGSGGALEQWRVWYRAGPSSATLLDSDMQVYPIVKAYTGTNASAFSHFLMVDKQQQKK